MNAATLYRTSRAADVARLPRHVWAVPALLTLLVGGVTLGRQPLSWDEAVTRDVAQRSLPQILALVRNTDSPLALYYVILHGWVRLGSVVALHGEVWLRLPSLLGAAAASGLLASLVAGWFSARVGLAVGALLAIHPMLQFYAQDARPYTLVTAAVVGSVALARRAVTRGDRGAWIAWVGSAVLVGYLHLFALPASVIALFALRVRQRSGAPWWHVCAAAAGVALLVSPLFALASTQTAEVGWIPSASIGGSARVLVHAGGGVAVVAACAVAGAAGLVVRANGRSGRESRRIGGSHPTQMVWTWLLTLPVLLVVANLVMPVLVARYLLACVPALCVLAVLGVRRWRDVVGGSSWRWVSGLLVACCLATVVTQTIRPYKYEDFRAAADVIGDRILVGDAVVFAPLSYRLGIAAYAEAETGRPALASVDVSRSAQASATLAGASAGRDLVAGRVGRARHLFVVGDRQGVARFGVPRHRVKLWESHWGELVVVEYGVMK